MMDDSIISAAKDIVLRKRKEAEERSLQDAVETLQQEMETRMATMERKYDELLEKLSAAR